MLYLYSDVVVTVLNGIDARGFGFHNSLNYSYKYVA